jgi:rod shape-determining protein MreB
MEIKGRDLVTGLPKTIKLSSEESWDALQEPVDAVIEGVKKVLEVTPPELAADIVNNGIVMTGGGSLLDGLDILLSRQTNLPVHLADDSISCVAKGTGKTLNELKVMARARNRLKGGPRRVL